MLVVGWVAATVAAVGVAWGGVNLVTGRVVEPLPPTLAAPPGPSPTTPGEPIADTPTTDAPSTAAPTPTPATSPSVRPTPSSTTPSPTPTPTATSSPAPTSSPTLAAPAAAETRSYTLVGGSVVLRFEPGVVTVVSASPAQGFTQKIEGNGTAEVEVEFRSATHRSEVKGKWENGPRDEVDEDAEDD